LAVASRRRRLALVVVPLAAACTPSIEATLAALSDADGTSATASAALGQANGHTVGLNALVWSGGPSGPMDDDIEGCTTVEDGRPGGPVVVSTRCTTEGDWGTSTVTASGSIDPPVAAYTGTLGATRSWPSGSGEATYRQEGDNTTSGWDLLEARSRIDVSGDVMTVDGAVQYLQRPLPGNGAEDADIAGTFEGTFERLSDDLEHVAVNGEGTYGTSLLGRVSYVTTDLVYAPDACGYEPLSGTTVVSTPAGDITYTYDGATDCGDDDDGDGIHGRDLVPWTGPAGSGEATFSFCGQAGAPGTWVGALVGLLVLAVRRRRGPAARMASAAGLVVVASGCTAYDWPPLQGLPPADGASKASSDWLVHANGHLVLRHALVAATGGVLDAPVGDAFDACTSIEEGPPPNPRVVRATCDLEVPALGRATLERTQSVDPTVASDLASVFGGFRWPDGPGVAEHLGTWRTEDGHEGWWDARVELDPHGDVVDVVASVQRHGQRPSAFGDGAPSSWSYAALFEGRLQRVGASPSDGVRVSGVGAWGTQTWGRVAYETTDLLLDPRACTEEPASGRTVVHTSAGDITYTY
ncbi:MAG: hypothetical protein KC656_27205, partial [Myxococcales bacterium]|nr:hypothetical protein [Myxococcales bacterium]